MTTNTVSQVGLIGVSDTQVWKPDPSITPGAAGDATAPFALGATVTGVALDEGDYVWLTGSIAVN